MQADQVCDFLLRKVRLFQPEQQFAEKIWVSDKYMQHYHRRPENNGPWLSAGRWRLHPPPRLRKTLAPHPRTDG